MSESASYQIIPNPAYGAGLYRRRVRVQHIDENYVLGEIEDDQHGFRVHLKHADGQITDVKAEALRIPMNTCAGATLELSHVRGALSDRARIINDYANPRANCTHMFDLLGFCVSHTQRQTKQRQYDVTVYDEQADGSQLVQGYIDGELSLEWQLEKNIIQNEGIYHGVNTQKGFARWGEEHMGADEFELGLVIQRSLIVAVTRRILVPELDGMPLLTDPMGKGVCYSYSEPAINVAYRRGDNDRNFEHTPELLLKFV